MQRGKNFGTPRGQISDRNIKMSRKKKSQMCVYMDKTSFFRRVSENCFRHLNFDIMSVLHK